MSTRFWGIFIAGAFFIGSWSPAAQSQSLNLGDDALGLIRQAIQQKNGDTGSSGSTLLPPQSAQSAGTYSGNVVVPPTQQQAEKPTAVELDYSGRADTRLELVGYNFVTTGTVLPGVPMGAVGDEYILGNGDQLIISIRGQVNQSFSASVDPAGEVTVPAVAPVPAAGRTFGQFKAELANRLQQAYLNSQVYVSLGAIRQLSILVAGEVRLPGLKTVTGVSSVVDALIAAGGVKKSGSLRRVVLVRDGKERVIDLYPVLLGVGSAADIRLRDGDRLVIPVLGPTIAVTGDVMRPGIYEITGNTISADGALSLAGGGISAQGNVFSRIRVGATGQREVADLQGGASASLTRGDILKIERRGGGSSGGVMLLGDVSLPGERPLARYPTLFNLISGPGVLGDNPYLPFIVIVSTDRASGAPKFIAVDASGVMNGGTPVASSPDYPLSAGDKVVVLSLRDVRYLSSVDVQNVLKGLKPVFGVKEQEERSKDPASFWPSVNVSNEGKSTGDAGATVAAPAASTQAAAAATAASGPAVPPRKTDAADENANLRYCAGIRSLMADVARRGGAGLTNDVPSSRDDDEKAASHFDVQPCPAVFDDMPDLLPFAVDHVADIQGEVRNPGVYPVSSAAPVSTLIASAGGLTDAADTGHVEVTNYSVTGSSAAFRQVVQYSASRGITAAPGDVVRVGQKFTERDVGFVMVGGEVERPGRYTIMRGERLSELLARAGGLTPQAYPIGSVFTREAARLQEQEGYEIAARELESGIGPALISISGTAAGQAQTATATAAAVQELVKTLRSAHAAGRVVTEVDPAILSVRPELDTVLQPGDALFVPKRPNHVSISGEVLHPGAQRFEDGLSASDYIRDSGGFSANADDSRVYVILPSGKAKPIKASFWNFSRETIPPGSTVVVPRDLTPFSFWSVAKDLTQILGQIALSAASLAVISSNN